MQADPKNPYAQRRLSVAKLEVAMADIKVTDFTASWIQTALSRGS